MKSQILVTGATGNVGQYVTKELLEKNIPVKIGGFSEKIVREKFGHDIPYQRLDFYDNTTYDETLENVSKMFLLRPPAIADVKDSINRFLDRAKEHSIEQIVFLSLYGVNPLTPHYRIEKHIQKLKIPYTFIRASFFMQNLSTTHLGPIKDEDLIFIPAGKGRTSFVDCRDIAHAAVACLTNNGHLNKKYTITGSESLNYYEVAEIFTEVLGRKITYISPKGKEFNKKMMEYGYDEDFLNVVGKIYLMVRLRRSGKVTEDFEQVTGRKPITIRQFVTDFAGIFAPSKN